MEPKKKRLGEKAKRKKMFQLIAFNKKNCINDFDLNAIAAKWLDCSILRVKPTLVE